MARKKQEIALQLEIETQEEWEEMLTKEGLVVIDVYQEWAGPCKAMLANFRRLRNELSDGLLRFAVVYQEWAGKAIALLTVFKDCLVKVEHDKMLKLVAAKADTIDSLERYRGKCQPCFLFYAGGVLVGVVRGANAPILSKTVIEELKKEHKVMNGEAERVEIHDPLFGHVDSDKSALDDSDAERSDEAEMVPKEVTVALIKPDVVKEGKTDEVLAKMEASGIEILKHEERQLTEEEARDFYSHLKDEPFFEELMQFMCSGPSHVLLLSKADTGAGIINEWRELIGPTNVEEAKEKAPDSLRAQYGTKEMFNALHGSDSVEASVRELAFFFPEYQVPTVAKPGARGVPSRINQRGVQRTLALIRPDALVDKKDDILKNIEEAGFEIALQKEIQLSREQAEGFYKEHKEQPYFEELITKMTSGPVLALGLARNDAISEWRKLLGPPKVSEAKEQAPQSLRAQYSIDGTEVNMLHGSDSPSKAEEELNYFFPMQQTVAVIKPDAYDNKDAILDKIKEAGFHVAARKETTLTKDIAELLYKQNEGKEYYGDLIDHMTSGPTLFMVLSKEDAVENWRGVIGPTDPSEAKEKAPTSIRAQFGSDVKANAVHGPSTEENAKAVIEEIFGDVKTHTDGKIDTDNSELKEGVEVEQSEDKSAKPEGEETEDNTQAADTAAADTTAADMTAADTTAAETEQSSAEDTKAEGEAPPADSAETAQAADESAPPPPEESTPADAAPAEAPPSDGAADAPPADETAEAPADEGKPAEAEASTEDKPATPAPAADVVPADGTAEEAAAADSAAAEAEKPTEESAAESAAEGEAPAEAATTDAPAEGEAAKPASDTPAAETTKE